MPVEYLKCFCFLIKILNLLNLILCMRTARLVEWHEDDIHVHSLYHAKHLICTVSENYLIIQACFILGGKSPEN